MKFNLKAFSKILRNQNAYKNGYLNGELDFDLVSPDENNALEERENGLYVEDLQPQIDEINTKNTQQDNAIKVNTDKNTAQDTAISTVQNGLTTLQNTIATYKVKELAITDTATVDMVMSGTTTRNLSANVKKSTTANNAISIGSSGGLYVQDVRPDLQIAINDINTLKQKQAFDVLYQGDVTVKAPAITIPGKKMNTYRKLDFIIDLNWARNTQTFLQNELSNELTIYFINSKMPNAAGALNFSITELNARAHFDTNTFEILNVKTITHSTSATGGFSRSDTNSGSLPIRIIGWY